MAKPAGEQVTLALMLALCSGCWPNVLLCLQPQAWKGKMMQCMYYNGSMTGTLHVMHACADLRHVPCMPITSKPVIICRCMLSNQS